MALPELIANSPQPGARAAITTLGAALTDAIGLSMTTTSAAPAALRAVTGQFRVIVDSEIMIIAASATGASPWTIIQRGAEGSTAATHLNGAAVSHYLTADAADARYARAEMASLLQNGVVNSGDLALSATSVAVGTGILTYSLAAANPVWVTSAAGVLVPVNFAAVAGATLTPGALPAAGKYRGYGIEIDTTGALSLSAGGTDQTTQVLALTNINTVAAAGKIRVADIIILNTAGSYTLSTTRDRRPWARGANGGAIDTIVGTQAILNATWTTVTGLQFRMELTGAPVHISIGLYGTISALGAIEVNGTIDGNRSGPMLSQVIVTPTLNAARTSWLAPGGVGVGTYLFTLQIYVPTGTATLTAGANAMYMRELLDQNATNGAS